MDFVEDDGRARGILGIVTAVAAVRIGYVSSPSCSSSSPPNSSRPRSTDDVVVATAAEVKVVIVEVVEVKIVALVLLVAVVVVVLLERFLADTLRVVCGWYLEERDGATEREREATEREGGGNRESERASE